MPGYALRLLTCPDLTCIMKSSRFWDHLNLNLNLNQNQKQRQKRFLLKAPTEGWRVDFAFRTCISSAVAAAIALSAWPTLTTALAGRGQGQEQSFQRSHPAGPGFSASVVIIVIDSTLGSTIARSWGAFVAALAASLLCYVSWLIVEELEHESADIHSQRNIRISACVPLLFVFTLLLGYLEIPLVGKKLGLSLLALNLVNFNTGPVVSQSELVWYWFADVLLGFACSIVGLVLPWPLLASEQFESASQFHMETLSDLFEEIIISFQQLPYLPISRSCVDYASVDDTGSQLCSDIPLIQTRGPLIVSESLHAPVPSTLTVSRWRVIRALWQAVLCFRRCTRAGDGVVYKWHGGGQRGTSNSMRLELCDFVVSRLEFLQIRSVEARFGPNRRRAVDDYRDFIVLLRELIVIYKTMEARLQTLEDLIRRKHGREILLGFHSRPEFRRTLRKLSSSLSGCFATIRRRFTNANGDQPSLNISVLHCNARFLETARADFDKAYQEARADVYYIQHIPHIPDLLMAFNSFVFLHDLAAELTIHFCLSRQDGSITYTIAPDGSKSAKQTVKHSWIQQSITTVLTSLEALRKDLFPPQAHLFNVRFSGGAFHASREIKSRLLSVVAFSLAMTFAAIYGYLGNRPHPYYAAFTIAYLSGGGAKGINVITSINRAIGTVIASVYSIIARRVVSGWSASSKNIGLGLAMVLFQFPAAYVRSEPLIGYSGTVAGLTVALLLLIPDITESLTLERAIDSFVGVALYLVLEIGLTAATTESIIFTDLFATAEATWKSYKVFLEKFRSDSILRRKQIRAQEESRNFQVSTIECTETDGHTANPPSSSRDSIAVTSATFQAKRGLLTFMSAEPTGLFMPQPFPVHMLNAVMDRQEQCCNAIAIMSWAVTASSTSKSRNDDMRPLNHLLEPLEFHLAKVEGFVESSCLFIESGLAHLRTNGEQVKRLTTKQLIKGSNEESFPSESYLHDLPTLSRTISRFEPISTLRQRAEALEEVQALFDAFEVLVMRLQVPISNDDGKDKDSLCTPQQQNGLQMTNLEVITTNAFLASLRDLVNALNGLSALIQRLSEFRKIRTTQNGFAK